ncbi:hypothetical protein M758_UG160900 [Ceratodon purpureus]|nr:hypothetical protein M758_UG160900 [Ceratodon purpureus]
MGGTESVLAHGEGGSRTSFTHGVAEKPIPKARTTRTLTGIVEFEQLSDREWQGYDHGSPTCNMSCGVGHWLMSGIHTVKFDNCKLKTSWLSVFLLRNFVGESEGTVGDIIMSVQWLG